MAVQPWKVLESSYLKKNIRIDRCETSTGKIVEPVIFEYGTWVAVVALTKQQEVLLIKQYRHGLGRILLELPGGGADEGEEPIAAARRELLEETGYASEHMIEVGRVSPNPASHTNMVHFYLALDVEKVCDQSLDETEEIDVFRVPFDEAILAMRNGEILASLYISAFFFALCHLNRIPIKTSQPIKSSNSAD